MKTTQTIGNITITRYTAIMTGADGSEIVTQASATVDHGKYSEVLVGRRLSDALAAHTMTEDEQAAHAAERESLKRYTPKA